MKYYAVIDTNVIVSALLNSISIPGIVLKEALSGRIIPILHNDIILEYKEVLHRPKFKFNRNNIEIVLAGLIERGFYCDTEPSHDFFPDPDDAIFYEVVMQARKMNNAYLVTGNIKHFPVKPYVVLPKMMLEIMDEK